MPFHVRAWVINSKVEEIRKMHLMNQYSAHGNRRDAELARGHLLITHPQRGRAVRDDYISTLSVLIAYRENGKGVPPKCIQKYVRNLWKAH